MVAAADKDGVWYLPLLKNKTSVISHRTAKGRETQDKTSCLLRGALLPHPSQPAAPISLTSLTSLRGRGGDPNPNLTPYSFLLVYGRMDGLGTS